jgi:hypothetical protein
MLVKVEQYIRQGVPDLARRDEGVCMKSIRPHRPTTPQAPVDGTRTSDPEPLQPTRQEATIVRFDDQMDMIGLDGEVHHAKVRSVRCGDRTSEGRKDPN